jgi:hypothetical protein
MLLACLLPTGAVVVSAAVAPREATRWPSLDTFPTGWYSSDGLHAARADLPPAPFRLLLDYYGAANSSAQVAAYVRALGARNVSVIMEVPRRWLAPALQLEPIADLAAALAPRPNLRGLYLADEPDNARSAIAVGTLLAARRAIHAAALKAGAAPPPLFAALCTDLTSAQAASWARAVDIRIYDAYPCRAEHGRWAPFGGALWRGFGPRLRTAIATAAAFPGGVWPAWQGSAVSGPERGWRQCDAAEQWFLLVAALVARAEGLLYYVLSATPGVVNQSAIDHTIVTAIGALGDEFGALAGGGVPLNVTCAANASVVGARLVARRQGGWLALVVRWDTDAASPSDAPLDLRCTLPSGVRASAARAMDGPALPMRKLVIGADGSLNDSLRPFAAVVYWLS